MKFSIIIPVYNVSDYLTEALDSVKNQTFDDYEVIIVNDGSTDSSEQIIDTYVLNSKKFRKINISNSGQGAARNKGVAESKGDYLVFFDPDDILDTNLLTNLNNTITTNHSKCIDIVVYDYIDFEGERFNVLRTHKFPQKLDDYGPVAWNKAYKKTFWNQNNLSFPEGIKYEDTPLVHVAMGLSKNTTKMIGGNGYFYRQNRKDSTIGEAVNGDILLRFNALQIMEALVVNYKEKLIESGKLDFVYMKLGKELIYLIIMSLKNKVSKEELYQLFRMTLSDPIMPKTFRFGGLKSKCALPVLYIVFFINYKLLPGDRKKYVR